MEHLINGEIETVIEIKRTRGRPKTLFRHLPNDRYNDKPLDKDYFKKYYLVHKKSKISEKIQCELCGRQSCKINLIKHQKSNICRNIQENNKII
jgi:hypothetical protein